MAKPESRGGYKLYWQIWLILLIVTLVMIFIDRPAARALAEEPAAGPSATLVLILVFAMLLKATLIAGYFMHLRYERLFLRLSVLFGLLINGAILFFLILPDGLRILEMNSP
ncbi:MAG: cytochrome C oxidase subunit IV family protein [bacterium]|nr:cytochrome C oxidase subunit IV family protein [bacterium]